MADEWTRWLGDEGGVPAAPESPRNVILLADLTRGSDRSAPERVDRDEIGALLERLAPRIAEEIAGVGELTFASFDDFTPAGIAARSAALRALLAARESGEPLPGVGERTAAPRQPALPEPDAEVAAALLDDLLGSGPAPHPEAKATAGDGFERAIRQIVEQTPSARTLPPGHRAAADAELRARLGRALEHPAFRALEASWLGLLRLTRQVETGDTLRLWVVNSPRRLAAEALAAATEALPEGETFALAIACFAFAADDSDDGAVWIGLARAAGALGCELLADAAPDLFARAVRGELELDSAWQALRKDVGERARLVGPRILARQPYEPDGAGAENLPLRVSDAQPAWGSGALLAAEALLTGARRLDWLPTFVAEDAAGRRQVGPAERVLTEREIQRATSAGLVALAAAKGDDAIIVYGL